ncbi:S8 family serine peptidase [Actinoplanes sp. NPDC048988]|uniref:S8 family serine peptidase n=1 Tax=Actinoplanes sp. NPDC048988 TaxID=3363901 RepID=UPI003712E706
MRKRTLGTLVTAAVVAVSGTAVPALGATGEGTVIGAGAPGAIPGRYIVTLDEHAPKGDVAAMAAGGDGVFVAEMSAKQARRLAADPEVRSIEQDRRLRLEGTQRNPSWNLDRIDQRPVKLSKSFTPTDDGSAVHAYVIDTGIRITHAEFAGGRATYGYDAVDGDGFAADCNGHGTHVAGTIGGTRFGVAKRVRLVAVRVLDCAGEGSLSQVIAGVNWVTANAVKPAVANMSMGGAFSPALEASIQKSINAGVTYVVAAGNEDANATNTSPAGLPAAITVGATDGRDRRAGFSNFGASLDLFAPGVGIRSAYAWSNSASAVMDGTSMASPHVAGAAALALDANPGMSPAQVRNYLVTYSTKNKVKDAHGSPNRLLFVPGPPAKPVIRSAAVVVAANRAAKITLSASRKGTWSLTAGRLPTGLKLSAGGVITGTPTGRGTAKVTVKFTDFVPYAVTRTLAVTIRNTVPVINPVAMPQGVVGAGFEAALSVADGRAGSWSVTAGSLPEGLTLRANGVIEGVPAVAGAGTFTAAFADGWGNRVIRTYTIEVA